MGKVGRILGVLVVIALIPACATQKDALLNDQNLKAGEYIEQNSVQPDIRQAGKDVRLNSSTLAKNAVGEAPKELQKPYTPENSKTARDDSDKSHTSKIWPYISAGLALLLPIVFGIARSHPWGAVVANLVEPYAKKLLEVHDAAEENPEDKVHRDEILGHIDELLNDPKAGPLLAKLVTKIGLEKSAPTT